MTTRAELLADLDAWTARDDISTGGEQDTVLRIAESIINRRVRCRAMEEWDTITATGRFTDLPARFLSLRALTPDTTVIQSIELLTPERIRESPIWNNRGGGGDSDITSIAYSIEGGGGNPGDERFRIVLAPEPTSLDLILGYYAAFAQLVDPTDTNWLLTNHYDIYLFATLMAVGMYVDDDEYELKNERRMEKALIELGTQENRARMSGSALIATGNPRTTV